MRSLAVEGDVDGLEGEATGDGIRVDRARGRMGHHASVEILDCIT